MATLTGRIPAQITCGPTNLRFDAPDIHRLNFVGVEGLYSPHPWGTVVLHDVNDPLPFRVTVDFHNKDGMMVVRNEGMVDIAVTVKGYQEVKLPPHGSVIAIPKSLVITWDFSDQLSRVDYHASLSLEAINPQSVTAVFQIDRI